MKTIPLATLIILLISIISCSKPIKYYQGYIYDLDRQPIAGVKVYCPYDTIGTSGITDSNGFFQIEIPKHIISTSLYIKKNHTIIDAIRIIGTHGGEQLHYSFVDGKNDTLFVDKSEFEKEKEIVIKKDSLIIHNKDTIQCNELHIIYDESGNIKEKGCQGYVNLPDISTGMSVGTWYYFENGTLSKEVYYHNAEFGKDYIKYKIYNSDGSYKEWFTNNFMLYETDSIALTPQEIRKRVR